VSKGYSSRDTDSSHTGIWIWRRGISAITVPPAGSSIDEGFPYRSRPPTFFHLLRNSETFAYSIEQDRGNAKSLTSYSLDDILLLIVAFDVESLCEDEALSEGRLPRS
jgi:hypothetical protein